MPLPLHYLFVAGVGRRALGPRAQVFDGVVDVLKKIEATVRRADPLDPLDAQPMAMGSGAAGADQVFLAAAQSLGWPIRLVLPVPAYIFERDFTTTDANGVSSTDTVGLEAFRRFLATAVEVEVISPSPGRHEAFTRCGNTLVAEADVLVALWDRAPGRQGGTNENLLTAQHLGVPLVVLDAQTGRPFADVPVPGPEALAARHAARHAEGSILHDVDEALRRSLKDPAVRQEFVAAPIAQQHARYGTLLAAQADKLARAYKRKNLQAVALHAIASVVGLLALLFFVGDHTVGNIATGIKVGAVALAFGLAYSAKLFGDHNNWVKTRFVREVNRSLGASAEVARQTGEPHDAFVPSSIWVLFRYLRRPLLLFHGMNRAAPAPDLLTAVRRYREKRLSHNPAYKRLKPSALSQHDYQKLTGEQAHHLHHRIEYIFLASTAVFFLCGIVLFTHWLPEGGVAYRLTKWLTVLLPVLSAALLVLPNLWDVHRRRRVAPALARTLARLDAEAAEVEKVLVDLAAQRVTTVVPGGVAVWVGAVGVQGPAAEAWARTRFAAIARAAEHAILTELIGFKTFVENAEVG